MFTLLNYDLSQDILTPKFVLGLQGDVYFFQNSMHGFSCPFYHITSQNHMYAFSHLWSQSPDLRGRSSPNLKAVPQPCPLIQLNLLLLKAQPFFPFTILLLALKFCPMSENYFPNAIIHRQKFKFFTSFSTLCLKHSDLSKQQAHINNGINFLFRLISSLSRIYLVSLFVEKFLLSVSSLWLLHTFV